MQYFTGNTDRHTGNDTGTGTSQDERRRKNVRSTENGQVSGLYSGGLDCDQVRENTIGYKNRKLPNKEIGKG